MFASEAKPPPNQEYAQGPICPGGGGPGGVRRRRRSPGSPRTAVGPGDLSVLTGGCGGDVSSRPGRACHALDSLHIYFSGTALPTLSSAMGSTGAASNTGYSTLSAAMGSTRTALLAGRRQARPATPRRTAGTTRKVAGSVVLTP
jgi:hypothetical protein